MRYETNLLLTITFCASVLSAAAVCAEQAPAAGPQAAPTPTKTAPAMQGGPARPGMASGNQAVVQPVPAMKPGERLAQELGLTEEQRTKLDAARKNGNEETRKLRTERGKLMRELADLVKASAKDEQLSAKLKALRDNRKATIAAQEKNSEAIQAIMTPAQQAKYALLMERQSMMRWQMSHRMMGPGQMGGAPGQQGAPNTGDWGGEGEF